MTKILSFFQNLFSNKPSSTSFPKITLGFRGEDLEYKTQNDSVYISSTWIDGRRIYMDNIQSWKSKKLISDFEKSIIFKGIVEFLNKECNEKPIIVINIDHDKQLWENFCEQYKGQIKNVEYQSDKEKEEFLYDSMLKSIRRGDVFIIDNKTITTEEQFFDYWKNEHTN